MRRWHGASTLLASAVSACAPRPAGPAPVARDPLQEAVLARGVAVAFIAAEARGDSAADTLLGPGADFIEEGIPATEPPRLAAVVGRGSATVEDVRTHVAGGFAWIVAAYVWTPAASGEAERGRATMILERRPEGWRIRHVHSSSVPPWP